jgi:hypothetical protein
MSVFSGAEGGQGAATAELDRSKGPRVDESRVRGSGLGVRGDARVRVRALALCALASRALVSLALCVGAAVVLASCSPMSEYPTPAFPVIEQSPPPRPDTPLNAAEVQRATDDLLTEGKHLSGNTKSADQANKSGDQANAAPVVTGSTTPVAKKKPHKRPPTSTAQAAAAINQGAGPDAKP